jgi:hypothetical protein
MGLMASTSLGDTSSIIKSIIEAASTELDFNHNEIVSILKKAVDDGTLTGIKSSQIKKISDDLLSALIGTGGKIEM